MNIKRKLSIRVKLYFYLILSFIVFFIIIFSGIFKYIKFYLGEELSIVLFVFIFSLIILFLFEKFVIKKIIISSKSLKSFSLDDSDLTYKLPIVSQDELGEINKGFNVKMSQIHDIVYKLKNIVKSSNIISNSLSSSSIEISTAVEESNASINQIFKNSEKLNENIIVSRNEVEGINSSLGEIVKQIDDQVVSIEESSAVIEELLSSINNLNNITHSKIILVEKMVALAKDGKANMDKTLNSMKESMESIEVIGELVKVIQDVSGQTKLLSMNASIEAAHAGKYGTGFNVVANEIKKLAETTAGNISGITSNINKIISGIKSSYELTLKTNDSINMVSTEISGVHDSFSEINTGMKEMSAGTTQISSALSKIVSTTEGIRSFSKNIFQRADVSEKSIIDVSKLSLENMNSLKEILSAINEITKLSLDISRLGKENSEYSEIINDSIKHYKITDNTELKTVEGLPLITWNVKQKQVPQRPFDPLSYPENDEKHWYDYEYRGWGVKKENIVESPCDGPEGKRIYSIIAGNHPYFNAYINGMKKIAQLYKINIEFLIGDWTTAAEIKNIEKALKDKPDLVILCPADPEASTPYIKNMNKERMPVIISSAMPTIEGFKYIVGFTGYDDWGSHRLLAQEFAKDMNYEGGYCIVRHSSVAAQFIDRTWPVVTEINKIAPEIKLLEMKSTELKLEPTKELVQDWIKRFGKDLKGIVLSDSDQPLIGTIETLDLLRRNDIILYVTGNNKISLKYLKEGKINGIRWESAEGDGAIAVEMAIDWFNGLNIAPLKYLPNYVIKREEVNKYLPAQW